MMHVGDIMMHVGDIMSTMEGVQYRVGKIFCYLSTPTILMISPTVLKLQRMVSLHVTDPPHGAHDIPPRAS